MLHALLVQLDEVDRAVVRPSRTRLVAKHTVRGIREGRRHGAWQIHQFPWRHGLRTAFWGVVLAMLPHASSACLRAEGPGQSPAGLEAEGAPPPPSSSSPQHKECGHS